MGVQTRGQARAATGAYAATSARVPERSGRARTRAAAPTHAQACAQRYASYQPATDTYVSASGQVRRCILGPDGAEPVYSTISNAQTYDRPPVATTALEVSVSNSAR
jgi:hypothetical protein